MNIQPLAFIDTWAFSATLYARYKERFVGEHHSMDLIPLRSEEGALPILAEWKSAKALLARIRVAAAPFMGDRTPDLGQAAVVRLKPGGFIEWSREEAGTSLHLPIVPCPGAWVYAGGEASVLPVGQLTYVNRRVPWSAVNFGEHSVIHLIVDVSVPDAADD